MVEYRLLISEVYTRDLMNLLRMRNNGRGVAYTCIYKISGG